MQLEALPARPDSLFDSAGRTLLRPMSSAPRSGHNEKNHYERGDEPIIADEVLVGFGRTGAWLGMDHGGVAPDLMVFAKGVNSEYVPLGGVLVGDSVYETFTQRPYPVGLTYSGHPLACAAAVGAIQAMHDEGTVAAAARLGTDILGHGLAKLAEDHPSVGDVRGIGGLWSVELVRDRETKEPLVPVGATGEANAPMAAFCQGVPRPRVAAADSGQPHPCRATAQRQRRRRRERSGHPGRGLGCSRHIPGLSVCGLGSLVAPRRAVRPLVGLKSSTVR
jgi:Aminotransferase class-III